MKKSNKSSKNEVQKQFAIWKSTPLPKFRETVDGDYACIELFKFEPTPESLNRKTILLLDEDGNIKDSKTVLNSKFLPIGRIVYLGEGFSKKYKVGDIITVPATDVLGPEVTHPDYLMLLQMSQSNAKAIKPKGMREKITSLEKKWFSYMYYDPFDFESHDKETKLFVIPSLKIKGEWVG